jgi:hypothetical protein
MTFNIYASFQASSSPGSTMRTPQMIQFGKYDITTWYSSPYPQVNMTSPPGSDYPILFFFLR